jgi:hypothetical protein
MRAAIYDPTTGTIAQTVQGTQAAVETTAKAMGLEYIELPAGLTPLQADGFDVTHKVVGGALVAKA